MTGIETLYARRAAGALSALDLRAAENLGRLVAGARVEVLLGAALASRQTRLGHVCADLRAFADAPVEDAEGRVVAASWPPLSVWIRELEQSPLVGDGTTRTPLVLRPPGRLYLYRYFEHEQRFAELVRQRLADPICDIDERRLGLGLERLFGKAGSAVDRQRLAALAAAVGRFTVVTGGPGTGKTSTVVKLLALLADQALGSGRRLRAALLAPTGKAAARLAETVRRTKSALDVSSEVRKVVPDGASTIHRALGTIGGSTVRFRHDAERRLLFDVVIVDESSMVDVALMRRLLEALPKACRLVLLGDRHQLESVEAGAVLGDLCAGPLGYSAEFLEKLGRITGDTWPERLPRSGRPNALSDAIVELDKSYRFDEGGGIGTLARAVRDGDTAAALSLLREQDGDVACAGDADPQRVVAAICALSVRRYAPFLRAEEPLEQLRAFECFRVLCAQRRGPTGVEAMNRAVESALRRAGLIEGTGPLYVGRPILVVQNDYQRGLFNGDVGVVTADPARGGRLRVAFAAPGGSVRSLAPAELPPHETVFCMTVHKSQGSEFDDVAIVLPEPQSPLSSRELFYTALTRARRRAEIFASDAAVKACLARSAVRASGLRDALWNDPP